MTMAPAGGKLAPAQRVFAAAVRAHGHGDLDGAALLYEQVLDQESSHSGALSNLGVLRAAQGRRDDAIGLYKKALAVAPDDPEILTNLGNQLQSQGNLSEAEAVYKAALAAVPNFTTALVSLGELLADQDRAEEAADCYRLAVAQAPNLPDLRVRLGSLLHAAGQLVEAQSWFEQSLEHVPETQSVLCLLGDVLAESGAPDESERRYREAAALSPEWAEPWHRIGLLAVDRGRDQEALAAFEKALALNPSHFAAERDRGAVLMKLGRTAEGASAMATAAQLDPTDWQAATVYADSLYRNKQYADALQGFQIAHSLDPDKFESRLGIYLCTQHLGHTEDAESGFLEIQADFPNRKEVQNALGSLYYGQGRNIEAKRAHERALEIDPEDSDSLLRLANVYIELENKPESLRLAKQAMEGAPDQGFAYRVLARALGFNNRYDDALAAAHKAIEVSGADDLSALLVLGSLYESSKDRANALKTYRRILEVYPDQDFALERAVDLQLTVCDWTGYDSFIADLIARVERAVRNTEPLHMVVQDLHNIPIEPELMAGAARRRAEMAKEGSAEARRRLNLNFEDRLARWRAGERWRLRVGYALPYTKFQSFTMLLHGVTRAHDPNRIETFGYSVDVSKNTDFDDAFRASFDHFRDVPVKSPETAGQIISRDEVDILIDVTGHTSINCQGIMAARPAPVQAQMFGFSFTCGGDYMDYLLTDHAWMPERFAKLCTEKLVFLPDSMMIGNRMPVSDRTFTRVELGLPEDGFVLCNFNQPFKIEPAIFSVWMKMLRRIPKSVLWLGGWDKAARKNLRREGEARGISGDRIVFADIVYHEDHLARLRHADLAVDNRYHGGGATSIDALWAGVPLLTCQGEVPASGNGKSLARAIGVEEMVVESMAEYEEQGVALAKDRVRYLALRKKVADNRLTCSLFNPALYARHLEAAAELMWEQAVAGKMTDIEVPRHQAR